MADPYPLPSGETGASDAQGALGALSRRLEATGPLADRVGDSLARAFARATASGQGLEASLQRVGQSLSALGQRVFIEQPLEAAFTGLARAAFGSSLGALTFHGGGSVTSGGAHERQVPAALFHDAPRLHQGGLLPDERPAILQTGERVLSRAETRMLAEGTASAALATPASLGATPLVQLTIQAGDPAAFRRSEGQMLASLAEAAARAQRLMG